MLMTTPDIKAKNINTRRGEFSYYKDIAFEKNLANLKRIADMYKPTNFQELRMMFQRSKAKYFVRSPIKIKV